MALAANGWEPCAHEGGGRRPEAYREDGEQKWWVRPFQASAGQASASIDRLCGMTKVQTASIFGFEEYLNTYGECEAEGVNLRQFLREFADYMLPNAMARYASKTCGGRSYE